MESKETSQRTRHLHFRAHLHDEKRSVGKFIQRPSSVAAGWLIEYYRLDYRLQKSATAAAAYTGEQARVCDEDAADDDGS